MCLQRQRSNRHAPTVKPQAPSSVVRSWWWAERRRSLWFYRWSVVGRSYNLVIICQTTTNKAPPPRSNGKTRGPYASPPIIRIVQPYYEPLVLPLERGGGALMVVVWQVMDGLFGHRNFQMCERFMMLPMWNIYSQTGRLYGTPKRKNWRLNFARTLYLRVSHDYQNYPWTILTARAL